jgi:hypothetical protein
MNAVEESEAGGRGEIWHVDCSSVGVKVLRGALFEVRVRSAEVVVLYCALLYTLHDVDSCLLCRYVLSRARIVTVQPHSQEHFRIVQRSDKWSAVLVIIVARFSQRLRSCPLYGIHACQILTSGLFDAMDLIAGTAGFEGLKSDESRWSARSQPYAAAGTDIEVSM